VYSISLGVVALFAGYLSDYIGRKNILLLGSGLMAVVLLIHPLAYDYYSLVLIRTLTGIAGGILTGSCVSYVRDYFPYEKRGWANGVVATGSAVGQIGGIPIGIVLSDGVGFAWPFVIFGLVMCFAFLLIYFGLPRIAAQRRPLKLRPAQFLSSYQSIIRQPIYQKLAAGYILMYFSITIFLVYFPEWMKTRYDATAGEISFVFLIGGIASLIAGPTAGKLTDKIGRKPVNILVNALLAILFAATVAVVCPPKWYAIILFSLAMFFISGRLISFQSLSSDITNMKSRGQVMCLLIAIGQLGMSLGAGMAGYIYSHHGFTSNLLIGAAACVLMGLLVWKKVPSYREMEWVAVPAEVEK
jgi:predicted MFS family arabinose efflux permease